MRSKSDFAKNGKTLSRRHANGKKTYGGYAWASVDDQPQEDLIEPVAQSKSSSRNNKRREKDVDTMFVTRNSDIYAPTNAARVKTVHAEDYAGFVADVGADEVDPYAIPKYGQTRLTTGDKEYVEELAAVPEKKPQERRGERRKSDAAFSDRIREASGRREPAPRESAPAKTKAAEKNAEPRQDARRDAQPRDLNLERRIRRLVGQASHSLELAECAVGSEYDRNFKHDSPIETLVSLVEVLIDSNYELHDRVAELQLELGLAGGKDESRRPERKETPAPDRRRNDGAPKGGAKNQRVEERDAESASARDEEVVDDRRKREEPRGEKSKRRPSQRRPAIPEDYWDGEDDEYDPIARLENLPDDEDDAAYDFDLRDDRSDRSDDEVDLDDWDEVESKKKSARIQKESERESLFQEASEVDSESVEEPREERKSARRKSGADSERGSKSRPSEKLESKPLERFGNLTLRKSTLKALAAMGYVEPTPIQSGVIPRIQAGVDVMGQAKTGTGKTAAFMIPIVEGVAECEPSDSPLAIVVVPTRELAVQARDETERIAKFTDLRVVACYGGKPIASQVEKIRRGVDIVIGTPGRVIDLTNRGALSLSNARWVVLDEADRMLDVGFRPDVEKILRRTPNDRQTLLFSATLPPPVAKLAQTYMKDPELFDFSQKDVSADTIEQFYLTVDKDRKFDALVRLLEIENPRQAIIFCRTKRHADALGRRLAEKFQSVEAIHGDLAQTKRDRIMRDFRAEKTRILVATDIVGRGVDVSSVSHIVNYDIPQYCDDYVHRVGRAGRMGREGVAFTFVTAEEGSELTRIEIRINRLLERYEIPDFEAYSKPSEDGGEEKSERKAVFGQRSRNVRRAL